MAKDYATRSNEYGYAWAWHEMQMNYCTHDEIEAQYYNLNADDSDYFNEHFKKGVDAALKEAWETQQNK